MLLETFNSLETEELFEYFGFQKAIDFRFWNKHIFLHSLQQAVLLI